MRRAWLLMLVVAGCAGHARVTERGPTGVAPTDTPTEASTEVPAETPPVEGGGGVVAATAGLEAKSEEELAFRYQMGVEIPMRDGVVLRANVYLPMDGKAVPAVFVKTPYNADRYHKYGRYFAAHGYAVALVDARGRGNSEGSFRPAEDDGRDGADVVEWLAKQKFCNGKVAMFGGSYDGFGQWATAKQRPPHLTTFVPTASVRFGYDFPMSNNISYPYVIEWLAYVSRRAAADTIFGDTAYWNRVTDAYRAGHAFHELDELAGVTGTVFRDWLTHPTYDAFWHDKAPLPAEMAKLDLPILTITGHYDDDQAGAMSYYLEHVASAPANGKRHYLIMGPWDHSGTRRPAPAIGGLQLGPASQVDILALHVQWFDWTMKQGPKPPLLGQRVAYYVDGAEVWRSAADLAAMTPTTRTWFLGSDGAATDVYRSGRLTDAAAGGAAEDVLTVDPNDARAAAVSAEVDGEVPVVDRADGAPPSGLALVYHTEPFADDTELGGTMRVVLHIAMDVPDTDLQAMLFEVRADGRTIILTQDLMRARYRRDLAHEELVAPGQVLEYQLDRGNLFGRRIAKGSRLRLVIGPPLGTMLQHNYQSGGVVADETAADARVGTWHLVHDAAHPSRIELGVIAPVRK